MVWWKWFVIVNAIVLAIQLIASYSNSNNFNGFTWAHAFTWTTVANLATLALVLSPTS